MDAPEVGLSPLRLAQDLLRFERTCTGIVLFQFCLNPAFVQSVYCVQSWN